MDVSSIVDRDPLPPPPCNALAVAALRQSGVFEPEALPLTLPIPDTLTWCSGLDGISNGGSPFRKGPDCSASTHGAEDGAGAARECRLPLAPVPPRGPDLGGGTALLAAAPDEPTSMALTARPPMPPRLLRPPACVRARACPADKIRPLPLAPPLATELLPRPRPPRPPAPKLTTGTTFAPAD